MDFQELLTQNGGFGSKIGEGVVQCWPQQTCSYSYFCHHATFGENGSRNATV